MKDKAIYKMHANICKVLANPLRIEIIDIINDSEKSFSELQQRTNALKSNLSQHLSLMVSLGILSGRKSGINSYFKLSSPKVAQACRIMREVLIENIKKQNDIIS
ncbi:MAG: ArsR family transcriptional regulator [Bacteroidetes bacterium]|nr:MAG: ArsR family transcriptional regulator [Bacteroidota bacterium]